MKKGQIYEGVVTKVNFPNKAEVQCEGERVIVKNALPGQVVKFSVNKVASKRIIIIPIIP